MEHALPYRSASAQCPRCHGRELTAGPLHHCAECAGTWIDEQTLSEHVGIMTHAPPVSLEWSIVEDRARLPCATCREPMDALMLLDVPVDRCRPHGVWFDKSELSRVLENVAAPPPAVILPVPVPPIAPDTIGSTLAFEVAGEVALGSAAEIAGEVGVGVVEVILEVIGAIFSAIDF
jgi:Zn-finger nucleic acid-binding protein